MLASPEEFDAAWDQYMKELDGINISLLEEEFNKLLQDRLELWYE